MARFQEFDRKPCYRIARAKTFGEVLDGYDAELAELKTRADQPIARSLIPQIPGLKAEVERRMKEMGKRRSDKFYASQVYGEAK